MCAKVLVKQDDSNTRSISLIITERCNLSCVYCYEHNKTSADMTFEQAKRIIDKELKEQTPKDCTYVDFFGGEPFLNFELIKQVYDYVMSFFEGKIRFFATTNGTLVHGEIQEWLKERLDFVTIGLSLDGTRYAHNLNRSNSFDDIDTDFFLKYYPQQTVKMTVSVQSLPYLAESVKYLTERGFRVSCNLAYMTDWLSEKNKATLEEQLNKLIEYYIANPQVEKCSMMNLKLDLLARPRDSEKVRKYCGTGTAMVCYDMQGNPYPCQLFAPITAGNRAKKVGELEISERFDKNLLEKECRDCYYLNLCPFCLGSNWLSTGNLYKPDKERCELYKIIFAANAKLKALEWEKGLLQFVGDEEQALLRSIVKIQELQ